MLYLFQTETGDVVNLSQMIFIRRGAACFQSAEDTYEFTPADLAAVKEFFTSTWKQIRAKVKAVEAAQHPGRGNSGILVPVPLPPRGPHKG